MPSKRAAGQSGLPRPRLSDFWSELPRNGRLLVSTVAVESFGRGLVLPFGVVYLHEVRGFPLDLTGLLLGLPALVALGVVGPVGLLIDRVGARRVIMLAAAAQIVSNVMMAVATTAPVAALAQVFAGAAFGSTWPAVNAMIASVVPSAIRQRYFGLNFTLVNLGIGVGGAVSGLYLDVNRPSTFTTVYLLTAAGFLAPIGMLLGPLRRERGLAPAPPAETSGAHPSYRTLLRSPVLRSLLLVVFLTTFLGYGQLEAGFTAYARLVGHVSTQTIGWAFAANTGVIVAFQLLVLQRIEGRRRTRVLIVTCLVWAASWLLLGLSGLTTSTTLAAAYVIACAAFFGFGETLMQPTMPAITNDLAPDHLRGRYNAMSSAAFQCAAVTAPILAGLLMARQAHGAFIALLVVGCLGLAVLIATLLEPRLDPRVNGLR